MEVVELISVPVQILPASKIFVPHYTGVPKAGNNFDNANVEMPKPNLATIFFSNEHQHPKHQSYPAKPKPPTLP